MCIKLFINVTSKAKVQKIKYIHTSTSSKIKFCLKGKYRQSQGNYRKQGKIIIRDIIRSRTSTVAAAMAVTKWDKIMEKMMQ